MKSEAAGRDNFVDGKLGFGRLQGPGQMVDISTVEPMAIYGIETISLCQPMLQRAGPGGKRLPCRSIVGNKRRRRRVSMGSPALIIDCLFRQ